MKTPRFKDKDLQRIYEGYLTTSEESLKRILVYKSGWDIAFTRGYENKSLEGVHRYPKNSQAYAAYAAGKERKKRDTEKKN